MANVGPKPRVTDAELLAIFAAAEDPVLRTDEVVAEVPIGRRATHDRLASLVDEKQLKRKKAGNVGIYWRPGYTQTSPSHDGD